MPALLPPPASPGAGRLAERVSSGVGHYGHALAGLYGVLHQQVVVARKLADVRSKALSSREAPTGVGQVAAHAHVGPATPGKAEVLGRCEQGFVANELVEKTWGFDVGREAEH